MHGEQEVTGLPGEAALDTFLSFVISAPILDAKQMNSDRSHSQLA